MMIDSRFSIDEASGRTFREWFDGYIATFDTNDRDLSINIALKKEHTLRVCNEIDSLGKELGLTRSDLIMADVLALFHDIGRFEQYRRFRTFVDAVSVNHAEFGVEILKENAVLDILDEKTADFIERIISYHNRAVLPEEETPEVLFFSRLLRDADKLDIYFVLTSYYSRAGCEKNRAIELGLPDTQDISRDVIETLMAHRVISHSQVRSLNDFKILQAAWVFDINFRPTYRRLHQKGYLDVIRASLPATEKVDEIFKAIGSYLEDRIS
ncbi:MAG TPA: HD domain-containing protein [Deltaproteobacteria bacterium]|nr:HD domain-containing protein [Deltaproteobacteria bacterium]